MIEFVVVALAVWRVSSLLVNEEGPLDIFVRLRKFVGVKYDEFSQPYGTNFISKLFACVWCMSIWLSAPAALVLIVFPKFAFYASLLFAISAVAIIIETIISLARD